MLFAGNSIEELNLLLQFDDDMMSHGIKVHSTAREEVQAACTSLFGKGLIDQHDGGYLTDAGIEARSHALALVGLLGDNLPES